MNDDWMDILEGSKRKTVVINDGQKEIMDSDNYCGRPVIGKIVALPMRALKEFTCDKPWACISIIGCEVFWPPVISEENRVDILKLKFDDIEFERPGSAENIMSEYQADLVLDFAEKVWEDIDLLMVHCAAGISRSTAVAKAISDVYQPEFAQYFEQLYSPNMLVYQRITEARQRR